MWCCLVHSFLALVVAAGGDPGVEVLGGLSCQIAMAAFAVSKTVPVCPPTGTCHLSVDSGFVEACIADQMLPPVCVFE